MSKPIPEYIALADDSVTVTLTKPTEANGIKVDRLRLRAPTVRDIRNAQGIAGSDDEEQRELTLFSNLAEVTVKDLENMTLKDYTRLQTGYFRLVRENDI